MKRVVSVSEMARICNVASETIRRWIDAGQIHAFKTKGGHRRIEYADLLNFIERQGISPNLSDGNGRKQVLLIGEDADYFEEEIIGAIRVPPNVRIDHALDSFEAGYMLAVLQPDIILIDPASPGVELQPIIRVIRRDPFTRDSVIFILSDRYPLGSADFDTDGLTSYEMKSISDLQRLETLLIQI